MIYFQILVSFASLIVTTTGFLFDTKCIAPPPCTCSSNYIRCNFKQLSKVPVFTRLNEHISSIYLDLSWNYFTTIPSYAFTNLSTVNTTSIGLYLDHNRISNIETRAFSGVENALTVLGLQNNNLTHIPHALAKLSKLGNLNLLGNPLVIFDASVLANISFSLNIFRISVDRFKSFPNELNLLTALSALTINGISFSMLNSMVFQNLENSLTALEMSYTYFDRIPSVVCRLKSLKTFRSDYSPNLSTQTSSIFDECNHTMTNVTFLSLLDNQLTTIPKLANIFPSLQTLKLYGNNLQFIESNSLAGLTSLTYINLAYNHFNRIPFAVNMAFNLLELNVDNNQIDTVEDVDLSSLHNLTTLSLLGNPIVTVSPFAFTSNPLLNNIDMSYNKIGHVPRALLGLNHLRNVDLNSKPIDCSCQAMNYLKSWNVTSINIYGDCRSGESVKRYLTSDLPKCP